MGRAHQIRWKSSCHHSAPRRRHCSRFNGPKLPLWINKRSKQIKLFLLILMRVENCLFLLLKSSICFVPKLSLNFFFSVSVSYLKQSKNKNYSTLALSDHEFPTVASLFHEQLPKPAINKPFILSINSISIPKNQASSFR